MKSALLISIALLFFLSLADRSFAEITSPYTVDEKDPVLFGDSTTIDGKNGLENYVTNYVGSYLHITFTYTHHTCCFSSYSPLLYITAKNPRATSSPTERTTDTIYQLLAGTHGTDWYSYDIQFDSTGYTVVVKKTGVTEIENAHRNVTGITTSDWAALANAYPLSPATDFSMSFTPLEIYDSPDPTPSSSESSSSPSSSSTKAGDRLRCVDTSEGMYCPNEQVREYYIKHTMEMLIIALEQLITLKQAELAQDIQFGNPVSKWESLYNTSLHTS